jgi:hypothetical protein
LHKLNGLARLAAAAAALLGAGSAQAENWWYVSHNADQVMLIDADTIGGDGANRTATVRIYAVRPDSPRSIGGARIEADCAGNRVRYLHITGYTPALQVIAEGPPPEGYREWRQLQPTQNGTLVVRFACGERETAEWRPLRLGALRGGSGDQPMLATLIADGVPPPVAALAALGRLTREEAEALLREVTAEEAAALRRHGFPR